MKWYTQQDMPYGKDPIVIKTIDKQIYASMKISPEETSKRQETLSFI